MKSPYTIAIDCRHIALIKRERGQFFVKHLRVIEPHVKPLDILKPILHGKEPPLVTGLAAGEVILRRLHLKLRSKRAIMAALPFQMEELLPFLPEEVVAVPTLQIGKGESIVDLMATSHTALSTHIADLKKRGVDPDVTSAEPVGLFRFAQFLYPHQASAFIYDPKKRILVAMKDHILVAFQVVADGDFDRALAYFQKKIPTIEHMLILGPPPRDLPLKCLQVKNEEWIPYATAIGLALDAAKSDWQSRQWLHGAFLPRRQIRAKKRLIAGFFSLCALLCLTLLGLSHWYFETDRATLLAELDLTQAASLSEVASSLERAVRKKGKDPHIQMNLPKVHEVLAWLSSYPDLQQGIVINRLRYQISKFPRLGETCTSEGKVECTFTADLPRMARAFHKTLQNECHLIDQRREILFSADHGLYRIVFFLKREGR